MSHKQMIIDIKYKSMMKKKKQQMIAWCGRESQQSGLLGLQLSSPGERERQNADGHKSGGQYIAVLFGLWLPLTVKPWVTLFEPLQ